MKMHWKLQSYWGGGGAQAPLALHVPTPMLQMQKLEGIVSHI